MKKRSLFLLLLLVPLILAAPCRAGMTTYEFSRVKEASKEVEEPDFDALTDSLPSDAAKELSLFTAADGIADKLTALGKMADVKNVTGYVAGTLKKLIFPTLREFITLLSVTVVSSLIMYLMRARETEGLSKCVCAVLSLAAALPTAVIASAAAHCTAQYVTRLSSAMNAMFPIMASVMTAGGQVTGTGVGMASLMLYLTLTENFTRLVLIPAAGALLALGCVSCAFGEINISSFTASAKKTVTWVLGAATAIFSFVLGVQTSLTAGVDSLAARTVKFALGASVPIVGGAVSEAISAVGAGLSLIRKTTGGVGLFVILMLVVPTLVTLFSYKLIFSACRGVSELLGADGMAKLFGEADSVVSVFAASSALSAVFFIFAVTLLMNSGISYGGLS